MFVQCSEVGLLSEWRIKANSKSATSNKLLRYLVKEYQLLHEFLILDSITVLKCSRFLSTTPVPLQRREAGLLPHKQEDLFSMKFFYPTLEALILHRQDISAVEDICSKLWRCIAKASIIASSILMTLLSKALLTSLWLTLTCFGFPVRRSLPCTENGSGFPLDLPWQLPQKFWCFLRYAHRHRGCAGFSWSWQHR